MELFKQSVNHGVRGGLLVLLLVFSGWAANSVGGSPFAVLDEAVVSSGSTSVSDYGKGALENIGDFDLNGTDDLLVGAYRAHSDSGSLYIEMMNLDGSYKGRYDIAPVLYGAQRSLFRAKMQVGMGLAVLKTFSQIASSCAEVVVSSNETADFATFVVELCRSSNSIVPNIKLKSDTTHAALQNTGLVGSRYGHSIALVDVLPTGESLLAFTAPAANNNMGRVYLMALNSSRTNWRRVGILTDTSASLGGMLEAGDFFGAGLAVEPDRDGDGINDLWVLAEKDDDYKPDHGAIYSIPLNATLQPAVGIKKITGSQLPALQTQFRIATSIASADMNHDGINDLLLGNSACSGAYIAEGCVGIATLRSDGSVDSLALLRKGSMGFSDANNHVSLDNYLLGSRVQAWDQDWDGMLDLVVGAGGHDVNGGLWFFRMKSAPWVRKTVIDKELNAGIPAKAPVVLYWLDTLFSGNSLTFDLSSTGDPAIATCMIVSRRLTCYSQANNATTKVTVLAKDVGNVPATDEYSIQLDIPIKVINGNAIPTTTLPASLTLDEDFLAQDLLDLNAYFQDDDAAKPLSYSLVKTGDAVLASLNGSHLQVSSLVNVSGNVTLQVEASDGLASVRAQLLLQVRAVPDAPLAVQDSISTFPNQSVMIAVLANDSDGDRDLLHVASVTSPSHGAAHIDGSNIVYSADADFVGLDTLYYRCSDGALESEGRVVVLVVPANSAQEEIAVGSFPARSVLHIGRYTMRDFAGIYRLTLYGYDGRLLWFHRSTKELGEPLSFQLPAGLGNSAVLRLEQGTIKQEFSW